MATEKKETIKYSKESLVNSKTFANSRDLLSALLEDGKEYSKEEVIAMIEKYKKGVVR